MFNVLMAEGLQMVTSRDGLATVRMNNGENRFRFSFVKAWMKILDEVERNTNIKGLIITGSGNYFSLGLDIEYFKTQTPEYVHTTREGLARLYRRLLHLPIPTVAAINGHAFGAGAFLALACDYRVMRSDRGWLCWPEVSLGMRMRPHSLLMLRLKCLPGSAARDAILFGKRFTAQEGLAFQLVDQVTSQPELEIEASKLLTKVLGKHGIDRHSLGQIKQDIYHFPDFPDIENITKL